MMAYFLPFSSNLINITFTLIILYAAIDSPITELELFLDLYESYYYFGRITFFEKNHPVENHFDDYWKLMAEQDLYYLRLIHASLSYYFLHLFA
jgi:hypothetical protein